MKAKKETAPQYRKSSKSSKSSKARMERGRAVDAATSAKRQTDFSPDPDVLQHLEEILERLADVDISFWPIHERVLRSRVHIRHTEAEFRKSGGQSLDTVRLELINALWWEIKAIGFLRIPRGGRQHGATGPTDKILQAFLEENPDATTDTLRYHLKKVRPNYGLTDDSLTVAISRARTRRSASKRDNN